MQWDKIGQLYQCQQRHPKLQSHAANPLPVHLDGDVYRVYFSARDDHNRSSVGAVDIDIMTQTMVNEHHQPFFEHGPPNSFYSHGVSIGNTYQAADGITYMLFMGWKCDPGQHWFGQIGRLRVHDDYSLTLDSEQPFMALDEHDPISLSYPWVHKEGDIYRMWYGSTVEWDAGNGEMLHILKSAESVDGHHWQKTEGAVPYKVGVAQAFSRPTVIQLAGQQPAHRMWYSVRSGDGSAYKIGMSHSDDLVNWTLYSNQATVSVSEHGWDSQMVEYPFVFQHKQDVFMLYNGNDYGKTGFGLAKMRN